jgi:hypothetical protein
VDGFHDLIPADLINVFDERELELLIGGIADIDVDDWKKHTDYRGYTESDDVIVNFWKASSNDTPDHTLVLTHFCFVVCSELGRRAEIEITSVHYWHVAHSCQRFQGLTGQ